MSVNQRIYFNNRILRLCVLVREACDAIVVFEISGKLKIDDEYKRKNLPREENRIDGQKRKQTSHRFDRVVSRPNLEDVGSARRARNGNATDSITSWNIVGTETPPFLAELSLLRSPTEHKGFVEKFSAGIEGTSGEISQK